MKDRVLGLDVGTSSVKAACFDRQGRLLARAARPLTLESPHPGWAEQEPGSWWRSACELLRELAAAIDPARVAGLGLSGQCPGHVLIDGRGEALGPAILWRDQRAVAEAAWIASAVTPGQAQAWIGTTLVADPSCPPARLLWLARHRSQDWERAECVLQPKDFIARRLTGRNGTDVHSAFCLAHPESGRYSPEYFSVLGLPPGKLPPVLGPAELLGPLTPEAAGQTGLAAGTPVVIGTIDAYCDNLAGGVLEPGRAVDVAGTSETVSLAVAAGSAGAADGVFPASIAGGGTFLCGPTQAGGETLRWLSRCLYGGTAPDFGALEAEAAAAPPGCEGLVFLPYLNGERAPLWDPGARAAFLGLTFRHDRRHLTRAVYESIGYAIRHILELAEAAAGQPAREVVVCGGGSKSMFWNQLKSDILGRPVRPTQVSETGCLGAAILASVGAGLWPTLPDACGGMVRFQDTLLPDRSAAPAYQAGYRLYRDSYPALRPVLAEACRP